MSERLVRFANLSLFRFTGKPIMFSEMVTDLKQGRLPEKKSLQKRFAIALVKKLGVIRTPYLFWPADTKINPSTKHLFWAAILLHDKENLAVVETIVLTELEEKLRARGQTGNSEFIRKEAGQILHTFIQEFIELAPDEISKENLKNHVEELNPHL